MLSCEATFITERVCLGGHGPGTTGVEHEADLMLKSARTRLIALVGGLLAATIGLSRHPAPATPPEPAEARRVDADGFTLPPGAVARLGSSR
jgi:hypothetical protein